MKPTSKRKVKIPKDFYKQLDFAITFDWNAFYKLCRDNAVARYKESLPPYQSK